MKKHLILIFGILFAVIFTAMSLRADDVTLAWNHPGADGYGVFNRDYLAPSYGDVPLWEGPELTATVTVPEDRHTAFVARAFEWGPYDLEGNRTKHWSGNSNEVVYEPAPPPTPEPPSNFLIQAIVAIARAIVYFFA